MIIIVSILTIIGLVLYALARVFSAGKDKEKLDATTETLESIRKANDSVQRANSDPDLDKRLRDRYGIDE